MSIEVRRARQRQMLIFLLVCSGMVILLGRLYYWQIVESQSGYQLALRANQEHVQDQVLSAPRGIIYDSTGRILATNVVRDDLYVEPIQFSEDHPDTFQEDLTTYIDTLHEVLPSISTDQLRTDFNNALNSGQWAIPVALGISPDQSARLRALHLQDTFLEPRTWRTYPQGSLAAQVLGYVGYIPGASNVQGVYGIEGQYNTLLSGKAGSLTAERDLNGNPLIVGASSEQPVVNGADLTLTIDSTMEYMVQTLLTQTVSQTQAESGTAVVINVHTGAVVAMAGAPTFDPNQYGKYANQTGCLHNEDVYLNPALYCAYEPGSTMKAVTMAAALDQGVITPDTTLFDPGYLTFSDGTPTVYNWNDESWGTETMTQVLIHSANVGAAHVAHDILGKDHYYPYLAAFGFGQRTGIDSDDASGYYRTPNMASWSPSDLARQAFGQSILATPLQVAMAYEAIANGGVLMRPYLVSSMNNNGQVVTTQPQAKRRVISARTASTLTQMLVNSAIGGLPTTDQINGYTFAAKTGTATTQGISADQTEASVAGFLPASNPQYVILVKLDRPQSTIYGGTAAAPLWKAIAEQLMWYYHVPPDKPQ